MKRTPTPKRVAAAIAATDLELVTDWWFERYPEVANHFGEEIITEEMRKIFRPVLKRLDKLSNGVSVHDLSFPSDQN
jgi:hypothetical protein